MKRYLIFLLLLVGTYAEGHAACSVVEGGAKKPFEGRDLKGLVIEKKSLIELNKEFPDLNVIEKVFKGELQTCSSCSDRHIACTN